MNTIDQEQKVDQGSVYGATGMILCAHPLCYEMFKQKGHKKYCSPQCKDDHHKMEREAGKKVLAKGTIHAALLENSPRLQRVARLLSDGNWYSTRAISRGCDVYAVSAIIGEMRHDKNGFIIECRQKSRPVWEYRLVGGETQLLRIV